MHKGLIWWRGDWEIEEELQGYNVRIEKGDENKNKWLELKKEKGSWEETEKERMGMRKSQATNKDKSGHVLEEGGKLDWVGSTG